MPQFLYPFPNIGWPCPFYDGQSYNTFIVLSFMFLFKKFYFVLFILIFTLVLFSALKLNIIYAYHQSFAACVQRNVFVFWNSFFDHFLKEELMGKIFSDLWQSQFFFSLSIWILTWLSRKSLVHTFLSIFYYLPIFSGIEYCAVGKSEASLIYFCLKTDLNFLHYSFLKFPFRVPIVTQRIKNLT